MWSQRQNGLLPGRGSGSTHKAAGGNGVDLPCEDGWQRAPVQPSQVGVAEQNTPALSRTHLGGSGSLQLTLGLGCSATRDCFRNRRGKRRERPARVGSSAAKQALLELFAVHMPICFVIAWLFLEAALAYLGNQNLFDCVSSVWGCDYFPEMLKECVRSGSGKTTSPLPSPALSPLPTPTSTPNQDASADSAHSGCTCCPFPGSVIAHGYESRSR